MVCIFAHFYLPECGVYNHFYDIDCVMWSLRIFFYILCNVHSIMCAHVTLSCQTHTHALDFSCLLYFIYFNGYLSWVILCRSSCLSLWFSTHFWIKYDFLIPFHSWPAPMRNSWRTFYKRNRCIWNVPLVLEWFSKRTGTSVDNGARSKNIGKKLGRERSSVVSQKWLIVLR